MYVMASFFFNATATTDIYTLSLHDALPISPFHRRHRRRAELDRLRDVGQRQRVALRPDRRDQRAHDRERHRQPEDERGEIGRASCRERGEIWVGAPRLYKKNTSESKALSSS